MRKKAKDPAPADDQYEDFNEDDFSELDELADQDEENEENVIDNLADDDLESEYHGADPDLPPLEQTPLENKKSIVKMLKENWLYIGIGAVVVIVAIYLIMGVLSPSGSSAPQPAAQQQQAPAGFNNVPAASPSANTATPASSSASAQQQTETSAASTASGNVAVSSAPVTANLSDAQIQTLTQNISAVIEQNSQDIEKAIASSQSAESGQALTAIQSDLNNLSNNLTQLNQALTNVAAKLAVTQSQLYTLLAQQTATDQNMTLRAVVPGRAWLIDKNGDTTSVTVGSNLGTFGTVTNIDSTNNTVTTSSGYVFQ